MKYSCAGALRFAVVTIAFLGLGVEARAVQGVNLGGWMVLEPWITPSLFYPFLNKKQGDVAFDSYTFCDVMNQRGEEINDPKFANKWMQAHWATWYTEEIMGDLATRGVKRVRLPIGDWTMTQYGPYIGCMDGAKEWIRWMMDTCLRLQIGVLIDVHTAKGSQNGFDNSGVRQHTDWIDESHFKYTQQPLWSSDFDPETKQNGQFNYANIQFSMKHHEDFLKEFGSHPALIGYEPVNEPLQTTDINLLADYYREVRKLVQRYSPQAYFVFHDSFRPTEPMWPNLFADGDWDMVAMDRHGYMAFWDYNETKTLPPSYFCARYEAENSFTTSLFKKGMEVWMGEWAFATDNCAHWLLGFNDATAQRQAICKQVDCPKAYYQCPAGAPGSDCQVDPTVAKNGPEGTNPWNNNQTLIENGKCWTDDLTLYNKTEYQHIANCTVQMIDKYYNASFMWTAHNQIEEKWDYIRAWDKQYFIAKENETDSFLYASAPREQVGGIDVPKLQW